jgi:flagellar motor switch/type III secretory pathway protein FliN
VHSDPKEPIIRPFEIGAADQDQFEGALSSLTTIAAPFCRGLRRTIPFLGRQRARLSVGEARAAHDKALAPPADGPSFLVKLDSAEQVWAALHFDGAAILALVDGFFGAPSEDVDEDQPEQGSDVEDTRPPLGDGLTLAQRALLRRLCGDISTQLQALVETQCKVKLSVSELSSLKRDEWPDLPHDAVAIDCRIEEVPYPWLIRLFMGSSALQKLSAASGASNETDNGHEMATAVLRVPVTVVAELGRVTLKLSQVLGLRAGDTLRLPSAANDPVVVRVEGVPKFDAVPVISRGQVAVKIHSRHSE